MITSVIRYHWWGDHKMYTVQYGPFQWNDVCSIGRLMKI